MANFVFICLFLFATTILSVVICNKQNRIEELKLSKRFELEEKYIGLHNSDKLEEKYIGLHNSDKWRCPEQCMCSEGLVNCSRLSLSEIPPLPDNASQIDFSNNHITYVPDGIFNGLLFLRSIDFSNNFLNDNSFTDKSFEGPHGIEEIDIGMNYFTFIPIHLPRSIKRLYCYYDKMQNITSTALPTFPQLIYLTLSQNKIIHVPPDLNYHFPALNQLDISFNTINEIKPAAYENFKSLNSLNLRFNQLKNIPTNLPTSLQNLDLTGNPINIISSNIFANLTKLVTLQIWQSSLTSIEDFAFNGLTHLTHLDVFQCHVKTVITNNTFHGLSSIQEIDLSLSEIPKMEAGALLGLNHLQTLWLSDNPLQTLDPLLFDHNTIPAITEIYLWGSHWRCDCRLKWLKKMQENSSVIQDPHLMVCAEPAALKGKTWDTISSQQFVC